MADETGGESSELQLQSYMESLQLSSEETSRPLKLSLDKGQINSHMPTKMTLRKKLRALPECTKRRVQIEPRKLSPDINNEESLKQFYINVNKKFRSSPKACLETIFEEPQSKMDKVIYLGARKIRRELNLKTKSQMVSKIKKRKIKIKKFFGKLQKLKCVSDADLISQLSLLEENED